MDQFSKQRLKDDVDRRDPKTNKTELKGSHPKCVHTSKEKPTGQHDGGSPYTLSGKSVHSGSYLKCQYTNTLSTENEQEE